MAANLPPVTDPEPEPTPAAGEPDLMGYGSVEELVAAKRASDAEAKRIAEDHRRDKERLAELEAARQSPAAGATSTDERPIDWAAFDGGYATAEEQARATAALRMHALVKEREDREYRDLQEIDDRAVKQATKAHIEAQRKLGRNIDVKAAQAEVEKDALAEKNKALEAALAKAHATKRDPDERPVTSPREVPHSQAIKPQMTQEEINAHRETLSMHDDMAFQRSIMRGEVKIKK